MLSDEERRRGRKLLTPEQRERVARVRSVWWHESLRHDSELRDILHGQRGPSLFLENNADDFEDALIEQALQQQK